MALVSEDFVKETTTSTGTGALVFAGVRSPGRTFSSVLANADTFFYAVSHTTSNEYEVGTGTYSSGGNSFTRSVLRSSNANAAVNFSAGTKNVDLIYPPQSSGSAGNVWKVTNDGVGINVGQLLQSGLNMAQLIASSASIITGTDDNTFPTPLQLAGSVLRGFQVQAFTASGTYTPTTGMKFCLVIGTGSGGGSGGADTNSGAFDSACGGGGGAGGTAIERFTASEIGASQTVTIGAAGSAGSNAGGNGGNGGNTTLGSLFTATGGLLGNGSGSNVAVDSNFATGGLGGLPTGALLNIAGGDGGNGFAASSDGTVDMIIGRGGEGGASFWGGGGRSPTAGNSTAAGGTDATAAGVAGRAFGSGASGAVSLNAGTGVAGATGAPGVMLILEFL